MNIFESLKSSVVEKDVESAYRNAFLNEIEGADITSPFGSDGLLIDEGTDLRMLLEFKYDLDFSSAFEVGKVLLQSAFYLKKFEDSGRNIPSIVFIGDIDECFAVHVNELNSVLDEDVDWGIAPSAAGARFPALSLRLGDRINPYIFKLDGDSKFEDVVEKILEINSGTVQQMRISEKNVAKVFEYFQGRVLKKSIGPNEDVGLFIQVLTNQANNYLHPSKKNKLVTKVYGDVSISSNAFESFFKHFSREFTVKERQGLQSVCDRLIFDAERRRQGAFFTPTIWTDAAHAMVTEQLGDDWRDEYVVWDCAAGTGNLTRDYRFKELYCSTLVQDELEIMEQGHVNSRATKFQYDFLNDDFDKLPEGLRQAFEDGRKIVFLINPPYGTACEMGTEIGKGKAGVGSTRMNELMREAKLGACRQQLYAQFMYRIAKLQEQFGSHVVLAMFAPPLYMTGVSFKKFRQQLWDERWSFCEGMLFQASNFADVKGQWGISFTIWSSDYGVGDKLRTVRIAELNDEDDGVQFVDQKTFYNLDDAVPASKWVREPVKGLKTHDAPGMTSGLTWKDAVHRGKSIENSMAYFRTAGNDVYQSAVGVCIVGGAFSNANGVSVLPSNFDRVVALFSARKSVKADWVNQKDEYSAPTEGEVYDRFVEDSLVYCLFNTSSQQSSLRQIRYKGKNWDIKNEFFWLGLEEAQSLADKHGFVECYQDAQEHGSERFMHKRMQEVTEFSPEAQAVLDAANELYVQSWEFRQMMHEEDESLHLNCWDAGWYQIKKVVQRFMPEEYKAFRLLYKELEASVRRQTYEVGFLRL